MNYKDKKITTYEVINEGEIMNDNDKRRNEMDQKKNPEQKINERGFNFKSNLKNTTLSQYGMEIGEEGNQTSKDLGDRKVRDMIKLAEQELLKKQDV